MCIHVLFFIYNYCNAHRLFFFHLKQPLNRHLIRHLIVTYFISKYTYCAARVIMTKGILRATSASLQCVFSGNVSDVLKYEGKLDLQVVNIQTCHAQQGSLLYRI